MPMSSYTLSMPTLPICDHAQCRVRQKLINVTPDPPTSTTLRATLQQPRASATNSTPPNTVTIQSHRVVPSTGEAANRTPTAADTRPNPTNAVANTTINMRNGSHTPKRSGWRWRPGTYACPSVTCSSVSERT